MSNERIDLTQFEGMTEGPWVYVEWDDYDADPQYPDSFRGTVSINMYMPDTERVYRGEHLHYPVISIEDDHGHEPVLLGRKEMRAIAAVPELIAELKKCYEREDRIIDALKGVWIGDTCWHQPSEHLEDIAETRGSKLGYIASLLQVDVNQQDIHELEYGCGGENCDHNASE